MDNEKMRLLTRPFSDIKSRPGRNGQAIQYVEGHAIVQRLNEALAGDWSFKVLEHDVREGELRADRLVGKHRDIGEERPRHDACGAGGG